jgi:hypothetical protein
MSTILVNAGRAIITNYLNGGSQTQPKYIAWGTGAGTPSNTDTTISSEVLPRVAGTTSQQTTSSTNDTYQVVGTQTAATGETITNAGLFDASTSGDLFIEGNFTGIPLSSGDSIAFTFKIQFS